MLICGPSQWHARIPEDRIGNWKLFAFRGSRFFRDFGNRNSSAWVHAFPQNLILAVGAALGSYLLIERPLLALRGRLRTRSLHESDVQVRLLEPDLTPVEKAPCLVAEAKE